MKTKPLPGDGLLNGLLRYEPDTGRLFWRARPVEMFPSVQGAAWWNNTYADTEAFTAANGRGYRRGLIFGQAYKAHRVIYKMMYGVEPEYIDHINRNPSDNRLENLRSVTHAENCAHFPGPAIRDAR